MDTRRESPPSASASVHSPNAPFFTESSELTALREAVIEKAVGFLSDPRVRERDPRQAVSFLLGKNLTMAEIREAFRRSKLIVPDNASADTSLPPAPPANLLMVPPGTQLTLRPPRPRTSFSAIFWGLTAAAGAVALLRELLRKYIAPLYFPELLNESDEYRHSDISRIRRQDAEIGRLRETVHELVRVTKANSERVDRLSLTMSSSGMLESFRSDLSNDPTEQYPPSRSTHAVGGSSASGTASTPSRGVLERLDELRVEVNHLKVMSGQRSKDGSLSCGGSSYLGTPYREREDFFTPRLDPQSVTNKSHRCQPGKFGELSGELSESNFVRRSLLFSTEDTGPSHDDKGSRSATPGMGIKPKVDLEPQSAPPSGKITEPDVDDFMSLEPAKIEEGWTCRIASARQAVSGIVDSQRGHDHDGQNKSSNLANVPERTVSAKGTVSNFPEIREVSSEFGSSEHVREDSAEFPDIADQEDFFDSNGFMLRRPVSVASAPAPDTALSDSEP